MFGNNLKPRLPGSAPPPPPPPPATVLYSTLKPSLAARDSCSFEARWRYMYFIWCTLHFYLSSSRHKDTERLASVCLLLAATAGGWLCSGGKGVPASKQLLGSPPAFSNCELGELLKTNLQNTTPPPCKTVSSPAARGSPTWTFCTSLFFFPPPNGSHYLCRKVDSLRNKSAGFSSPSADPRPAREPSDSLCPQNVNTAILCKG